MRTIEEIRTELNARRGDWPAICRATGLAYHTLTKFAQGRIKEMRHSKLTSLSAHFDAEPRNPCPKVA
jgi:hypothetical protein